MKRKMVMMKWKVMMILMKESDDNIDEQKVTMILIMMMDKEEAYDEDDHIYIDTDRSVLSSGTTFSVSTFGTF